VLSPVAFLVLFPGTTRAWFILPNLSVPHVCRHKNIAPQSEGEFRIGQDWVHASDYYAWPTGVQVAVYVVEDV